MLPTTDPRVLTARVRLIRYQRAMNTGIPIPPPPHIGEMQDTPVPVPVSAPKAADSADAASGKGDDGKKKADDAPAAADDKKDKASDATAKPAVDADKATGDATTSAALSAAKSSILAASDGAASPLPFGGGKLLAMKPASSSTAAAAARAASKADDGKDASKDKDAGKEKEQDTKPAAAAAATDDGSTVAAAVAPASTMPPLPIEPPPIPFAFELASSVVDYKAREQLIQNLNSGADGGRGRDSYFSVLMLRDPVFEIVRTLGLTCVDRIRSELHLSLFAPSVDSTDRARAPPRSMRSGRYGSVEDDTEYEGWPLGLTIGGSDQSQMDRDNRSHYHNVSASAPGVAPPQRLSCCS